MNNRYFPVQRSVPLPQALRDQLLVHWDLPDPLTCHLYQRGINDIYVVQAGSAKYYLRITPSGRRSEEQLTAEAKFSSALVENQLAVAKPIVKRDGGYVHSLEAPEGVRHAVLFADAGAEPAEPWSLEQHGQVGRTLAQMHQLASQHPAPNRAHIDYSVLVEEPLRLARATFPQYQAEVGAMAAAGEALGQALAALPKSADLYGLCHADFHAGNILFNAQGAPAIIDFDECGHSWFIYDVATYVWSHLFPQPHENHEAIRNAFLSGYQEIRPLSEAEVGALPLFVALRHFWVGGLAIRQAENDGMSALNDQQFLYFLYFLQQCMEQMQSG